MALLGLGGGLRHEGLGGGPGDGHQVEEGNRKPDEEAGVGEAEAEVAYGSADEAEDDGEALAKFLCDGTDEESAVDDLEDADHAERDADRAGAPVVSIAGVEDVDVHQRLLREVAEDEHGREQQQRLRTGEHGERADGVGALPGERVAVFE